MRTITQVAILALLGGAGAGWHFYADKLGVPPPAQLLGLQPAQ